jgi:hypothetical protein
MADKIRTGITDITMWELDHEEWYPAKSEKFFIFWIWQKSEYFVSMYDTASVKIKTKN